MHEEKVIGAICDANVLIDYAKDEARYLALGSGQVEVFHLTYAATDQSIADAKEDAEDGKMMINLFGTIIPWIAIGLGALVALGGGALIAALAAVVGDLAAGSQQGMIMGALATAGDTGSAAGPLLAYALAVTMDLAWVYMLCAGLLVLGLLGTWWVGREKRA